MSYRLLSYRAGAVEVRSGILLADDVHDIAAITGKAAHASLGAVLSEWRGLEPELARCASELSAASRIGRLTDISLVAPVAEGAAIYCAAANFKDHMMAMAAKLGIPPEPDPRQLDVKPYHFLKPTRQTVADPGAIVAMPRYASCIDWEVELVAVIGKPAHEVSTETALDYVAGYTVGNDISVRDRSYMKRPNVPDGSLFRTDFLGMKGFDRSCPIGPWIVPARVIPDPQRLNMKLWVDDQLKQNSSTAQMIFSVAEQIAHLSTYATLLPGDLVLTGTPAGTGAESDTFLKPGQTMRAWIEHIGELRTSVA